MGWRRSTPFALPIFAGLALALVTGAGLAFAQAPPAEPQAPLPGPAIPAPTPGSPMVVPPAQVPQQTPDIAITAPPVAFANGPASIADLAAQVMPSVVNISSTTIVAATRSPGQAPQDQPMGDLLEDFFNDEHPDPTRRVESLGTGFIVDSEGIIVTNFHVIDGADEIVIFLNDGTRLMATLVGRDNKTDLAVLKVEPPAPLPALEFAESEAMRIGDWVMAIGNPFGLGGSVSIGILSARNRDINTGPYDDFLQTDAAINRGNSGGPLLNMNGEVVGVTTAIISPTGASVGVGFAVPAEMARYVIDQLVEFGETRRGLLGVRIQDVTIDLAEGLGMDRPRGALISGMTEDSPAVAAGIERGDVVVAFNGVPIGEMRDLPRMVASSPIDVPLDITVLRDGAEMTLSVRLARMTEDDNRAVVNDAPPAAAPRTLGLMMAEVTDSTRRDFNIAEGVTGVVVTSVAEGSAAAEKGVVPGDIILEVGQNAVAVPADVETQLAALAAGERRAAILLLVRPDGQTTRYVALRLD
ncbi:MAG: Do family serine endopeptidase [Bauldia sp.]|nr:Do family serine endopeptidase [Bauldia sp.]